MSKNKKIEIILSVIVIILIAVFLYMKIEKSEEGNGFVGDWLSDINNINRIEKTDNDTFKVTMIGGNDGKVDVIYNGGYITDDGYLVFRWKAGNRYIGYKVEDKNTLSGWRFWIKEDGAKPEDCVMEDSGEYTRNDEN